ncbi:uncharacterized protein LOC111286463 [Durio zibethinus]|uniref:Uncharacterized protein LOC111286463 n=1 Tax=Durio zibethinus TaxID=66656 RepID=A0A6P5XVE0_DURZI|nr:uncharacterized protein LOC111286463 [Durio zibethinus]
MAVVGVLEEEGSLLRKRKRKKIFEKKNLDVHEKVEVRSVEEGFQGSWHQGTVIAWDKQGCHVKYDYLLLDDCSDNLVDIVGVSPVIEGIVCPCENHCNYRGSIRLLPPKLEFSKWNLCYGLCVDVWYKEAWWEGVIFDQEDGSEKRRVFFPDLGDEMIAEICNLRITQDWDDLEEEWCRRGNWLFLELIEQYEQEWYISVSVKQLWYDLREKKGFQNFRDWTFYCNSLWKELVLEVIKDNHEITVNHFLRVLGLHGSSQPEPKSILKPTIPDADVKMSSDADLADTFAFVPFENPTNSTLLSPNSANVQSIQEKSNIGQLVHISKDDTNVLPECNGSSLDKAVNVLPEALLVSTSVADGISCISSVTSNDGFFRTGKDMAKRMATKSRLNTTATWITAGPDLVPKAESCPDAIAIYALAGKKHGNALITDVRKHLLYQGWKIESKQEKHFVRMRYISPTGDCYYSLYKLCLNLMNHSGKHICSNTKDVQIKPNIKDLDVVEPEYCPQAVLDWSKAEVDEIHKCLSRSDMTLMAKKHLSWLGWAFHYASSNGRRHLCYTSPRGRTYHSLREACKICIKEGGISQDGASPSRPVDKINVGKVDSQLASEKLSSALSTMDVQRSLMPSNAESENWSRMSYSKLETRNLVKQSRVGQRTRKPKRKRKDSLSYLVCDLVERRADLSVTNTSISRLKGGKSPAALIKLRENLKGSQHNRVLRSTKRVQQVVTPSPLHQNPQTVLSWLIDNNVVLPRSKVHYQRNDQMLKVEGRITRDGIKCNCCDKVYTLGGFVAHAGSGNHRPAAKIFLEDGRSLLDCQLQIMQNNKMKKPDKKRSCQLTRNWRVDNNDNICSVCHYGGELILCDQCPSSFHKSCLGLVSVPDGDWFCPSCCCGICCQSKLKEDGKNIVDGRVLTCAQCEHKYHVGCICSRGADRLEICAKENWFCSKKCQEIFLGLHELLGRPIPVGTDNLTWTIIKSTQSDTHDVDASDNEAMVESYSKLSIALAVMHECFEPVKEPQTGRDLVADIIFSRSSELNRLNFQGFYTILLERNDELITVANVRVHGEKVAEIPLIGTRFHYRRLGMCRILMNELEKKLMELGVQRLILPAVSSVLHTWTASFGFSKMMPSERLQFVDYTFLDFQGAIMCQKLLLKRPLVESNLSIGSPFELHSDAFESSDNVDVDGSSSVSEVFRAAQIKENGFMDQGLLEYIIALEYLSCLEKGKITHLYLFREEEIINDNYYQAIIHLWYICDTGNSIKHENSYLRMPHFHLM